MKFDGASFLLQNKTKIFMDYTHKSEALFKEFVMC